MDISFPIEFIVEGTPVSFQAKRPEARAEWKERVRSASRQAISETQFFASSDNIAVTMYYLPEEAMQGDVDNIIKPILDARSEYVYLDVYQVERVVAQKFEPGNVFNFSHPTGVFAKALSMQKPLLYIRISNDPFEELK